MKVIAHEDMYISSTWGSSIRLYAGQENEFRYMRDDVGNDYLDLGFEEECIRMYFIIRGV